jgi:hypothetical protein
LSNCKVEVLCIKIIAVFLMVIVMYCWTEIWQTIFFL